MCKRHFIKHVTFINLDWPERILRRIHTPGRESNPRTVPLDIGIEKNLRKNSLVCLKLVCHHTYSVIIGYIYVYGSWGYMQQGLEGAWVCMVIWLPGLSLTW